MTVKMEAWRRSSLKKWDDGLWGRLEKALEKYDKGHHLVASKEEKEVVREHVFYTLLWHECGFCDHTDGVCSCCPLYPKYCNDFLDTAPYPKRMERAWIKNSPKRFEMARMKFEEAMMKAEFKKKEELPWQG